MIENQTVDSKELVKSEVNRFETNLGRSYQNKSMWSVRFTKKDRGSQKVKNGKTKERERDLEPLIRSKMRSPKSNSFMDREKVNLCWTCCESKMSTT